MNIQGLMKEIQLSACPRVFAGLDYTFSQHPFFYQLYWELKGLCWCEGASGRSTLANKKKKSWSEINAFYFLKLLPLSTATAGGQPPACLPVQPYTLGLKSPDAAQ